MKTRNAFTLIELLVVIAILESWTALLEPGERQANPLTCTTPISVVWPRSATRTITTGFSPLPPAHLYGIGARLLVLLLKQLWREFV